MPKPPAAGMDDDQNGKRPRKVDQAFEEVAKLSGSDLPPTSFFQEFLNRVIWGVEAPAGAVWLRTPQGFLQLQCQQNIETVGLDQHKGGRQSHNELLRQAFQTAKPMMLEPFGTTGIHDGMPAGNPTGHYVQLAPVQIEKETVGLVEIWQDPRWDIRIQRTCLNYLVQMAGYASNYLRTTQGRKLAGQEQIWTQLETFAREIHASLDPTRVAYQIANEGRRLVGCDRLSVATVEAKKAKIEAVSGADVIEKRSNLIVLMRALVDAVLAWGEKLVYTGTKDESLPPDVLTALDDYLAESNSKLLVLLPLRDERQKDKAGPARSALIMENFETPENTEPLTTRLEVVGRHATSALYNSTEMRRVPLGWLWRPVAAVQEGLGGKTKALITGIVAAVVLLIAAMIFVPYELEMDSNGQLLPVERQRIYPTNPGRIDNFLISQNDIVGAGAPLVVMYDNDLKTMLMKLKNEAQSASDSLLNARKLKQNAARTKAEDLKLQGEIDKYESLLRTSIETFDSLVRINNADPNRPGYFWLKAPPFTDLAAARGDKWWTVLDADFREKLNQNVKPSDPILRLGNKKGRWELGLKIPQKHIGQVLAAFGSDDPNAKLDVAILVTSKPTLKFRGVLYRGRVAGEATPNRDEHNESAPVVICYVSLDDPSIPEVDRVPEGLLVTGVEVHAKIRCGKHPMGYSLFYGVWEFFYEKVVFFF
jgi:hypothetical protein